MILSVALTDLVFAAGLLPAIRWAPTKRTRRLLTALLVYVLIETAFHVPMENAAAAVMGWLRP